MGLLLLVGACLTRIEGLTYLGLAGVGLCAAHWRSNRRRAIVTAGASAILVLVVFAADLWVPSSLSGRVRSARAVTLELNERAKALAEVTAGEGIYGQAVERIEQGYGETAIHHLNRVIRPMFVLVPIAVAGLLVVQRRRPLAALLLTLVAVTPLIYCAVLHFLGVALFDRFFLPSAVVVAIAASYSFQEALARLAALASSTTGGAGRCRCGPIAARRVVGSRSSRRLLHSGRLSTLAGEQLASVQGRPGGT